MNKTSRYLSPEQRNRRDEQGGRRPYVFELDEAEVAKVGDGEVRGLEGYDDLHQLHRLRPHQIHRGAAPAPATARHGRRARVPRRVSSRGAAPPSDPWRSDEGFRIGLARAERMSGVRGGGLIGSSRREEAEGEGRRASPEGRGPCGIMRRRGGAEHRSGL